jgi:hypothetical protein
MGRIKLPDEVLPAEKPTAVLQAEARARVVGLQASVEAIKLARSIVEVVGKLATSYAKVAEWRSRVELAEQGVQRVERELEKTRSTTAARMLELHVLEKAQEPVISLLEGMVTDIESAPTLELRQMLRDKALPLIEQLAAIRQARG